MVNILGQMGSKKIHPHVKQIELYWKVLLLIFHLFNGDN